MTHRYQGLGLSWLCVIRDCVPRDSASSGTVSLVTLIIRVCVPRDLHHQGLCPSWLSSSGTVSLVTCIIRDCVPRDSHHQGLCPSWLASSGTVSLVTLIIRDCVHHDSASSGTVSLVTLIIRVCVPRDLHHQGLCPSWLSSSGTVSIMTFIIRDCVPRDSHHQGLCPSWLCIIRDCVPCEPSSGTVSLMTRYHINIAPVYTCDVKRTTDDNKFRVLSRKSHLRLDSMVWLWLWSVLVPGMLVEVETCWHVVGGCCGPHNPGVMTVCQGGRWPHWYSWYPTWTCFCKLLLPSVGGILMTRCLKMSSSVLA